MIPDVAVEPPPGWVAFDLTRPKLAESAGAELTSYRASATDRAVLASGCVATPIPGWVDEMRPAVEARTIALAGAVTERISGVPIDARPDGEGTFDLRPASDLGSEPIGKARTFVGFDASRVFTCFVTCAARSAGPSGPLGCEEAVRSAALEGSTAPPRPGIALRSVTWAVHHPRPVATAGGVIVVLAGVIAVVTRRRPRSAGV